MPKTRRGAMHWAVIFGVSCSAFLMSARGAAAQSRDVASAASVKLTIDELTAQWASLERPLIGVTNLSDVQRDAIEMLEDRHRKLFDEAAGPIRNARQMLLRQGPFDRHGVERALDAITELRKHQLELLRRLLTDDQRIRFDENMKEVNAEEASAVAKRQRDAQFYTP